MGDKSADELSLDRNLAWGAERIGRNHSVYLSSYAGRGYNSLMKVPAHEVNGEEALVRIQKRARELACSGKFAGWRTITFELQFEPALKDIFWFHSESR